MKKDWHRHTHYKSDACVIWQVQRKQQAEETQAPRNWPKNMERKHESERRFNNNDCKNKRIFSLARFGYIDVSNQQMSFSFVKI